jgi:NitT/TauT family transport system substrate-binding protein
VVAAAASSSEFEPEAKQRGLTILAEGTDATPKFVKVCMMSTARKIKQKREIMTRFLAASAEAYQYSLTHRDETIKLTREVANLPPDDPTAPFIYDQTVSTKAIHPDLSIPVEDLQWTEDMMVRNDALSKPQPVKNFIDDSVRTEALKLVSGN